jgi:hypothetical protein
MKTKANGMSLNEEIIRAFASAFNPTPPIVKTERLNGERVKDGWQTAFWDQKHSVGFTAVAYGEGHLRAWVETGGESDVTDASIVGTIFRRTLEQFGVYTTDGADGKA